MFVVSKISKTGTPVYVSSCWGGSYRTTEMLGAAARYARDSEARKIAEYVGNGFGTERLVERAA